MLRSLRPAVRTSANACRSFQRHASTKKHQERRLLKYSIDQVYDVVSDVSSYNQFVPWCVESTITKQNAANLEAELAVGFQMFKERYTSDVTLNRPESVTAISVETTLLEYLHTEWKLTPASDPRYCWVHFKIEFKFKSALYNQVSDLFFQEVVNNMIHAFENRCHQLYDHSHSSRNGTESAAVA
jgi:ribosome-associated toxin RatA of RatAB toxin-antitoxin module